MEYEKLRGVRQGSFNFRGDNKIGERQFVSHQLTQEDIAKELGTYEELCEIRKGGGRQKNGNNFPLKSQGR